MVAFQINGQMNYFLIIGKIDKPFKNLKLNIYFIP